MLTTSRKIEIATAVMEDPRLGHRPLFGFEGICSCSIDHCSDIERPVFMSELWDYRMVYSNSWANRDRYWFPIYLPEARTERIEFLKKYIQHLKEQL